MAPEYAVQFATRPVPDWVKVRPAGAGMDVRIRKLLIPDSTRKPGNKLELLECSIGGPLAALNGYWTMNTLICGDNTNDGMLNPRPAAPNETTPRLFWIFAAYVGSPKFDAE